MSVSILRLVPARMGRRSDADHEQVFMAVGEGFGLPGVGGGAIGIVRRNGGVGGGEVDLAGAGVPPTLIPSKPVNRPNGREIPATIDRTCMVLFIFAPGPSL